MPTKFYSFRPLFFSPCVLLKLLNSDDFRAISFDKNNLRANQLHLVNKAEKRSWIKYLQVKILTNPQPLLVNS